MLHLRKLLPIAALFLLFFAGANAQDQRFIDSLEQAIQTPENDSVLAVNLNHLAWQYMRIEPSKGVEYCQRALDLSTAANDSAGMSKAQVVMGTLAYATGDIEGALDWYEKSRLIREAQGDQYGAASIWNNVGNIYMYQSRLREATEFFIKALNIYQELGLENEAALTAGNLGSVFATLLEWETAEKYYRNYVAAARAGTDSAVIAMSLHNLGISVMRQHRWEEAHDILEESETILRKLNNQMELGLVLATYGSLLREIGQHEDSYNKLAEAENYARAAGNLTDLGATVRQLAIAEARRGNIARAKKLAAEGEALAHEMQSTIDLSDSYESWAFVHEAEGNYKKALFYTREHQFLADSIRNERTTEQVADMQTRYETTKKELEIERLTQAEQIARLEGEQAALALSQRNTQLLVLGLALALVLAFGLFFFYRSKQHQQAELQAAVIREQEQGLKAVIQAQEEERKRIAKDLHDGIGQQLSGLKLAWSSLTRDMGTPKLEERLAGLTKVLDESCSDVRNLSHQMMPRALRESGVAPAINDMLHKSLGHTDITYEYDTFGADGRYAEEVELTLYRVAQELVNNIMKHAGATHVNVQLLNNRNTLVLLVEDNGKGFDFDSVQASGMGLLNIATRLKSVAGTIAYERGPEGGTAATVRVPAAPAHKQTA